MKNIAKYPKTIVAGVLALLICLATWAGVHQTREVGDIHANSAVVGSSDNFNFVSTWVDDSGTNFMGVIATNTLNPAFFWATNSNVQQGITTNYTIATSRVLVIRGGIITAIQ